MRLHEVKIWLAALGIPVFCYFFASAAAQSESRHRDLMAIVSMTDPRNELSRVGSRLYGDDASRATLDRDLVVYYLLHPSDVWPGEHDAPH